MTLGKVMLSLSSLLMDPEPNDPLNTNAAELYLSNKEDYCLRVKDMV